MAAGTARVSIVVNTYNGERYIGECLGSVLGLRGDVELQVIVADDASADSTEAVVRSFKDPRITYLRHQRNLGAATAINHAFARVTGEFVGRIDYDDRYRPDFLEKTLPVLQQDPRIGLVCGGIQMINDGGVSCGMASPVQAGHPAGTRDRLRELLEHNFISAPTILARTVAWKKALPVPSEMNFCDWYMSLHMAHNHPVAVVDDVLADYRVHPANMHSTMVVNRSGERITWQVLDYFFRDSRRAAALGPWRAATYARHAAEWGDRYFGAGMNADARRCYLAALQRQPALFWRGRFLHRLAGLLIGRRRYERLKSLMPR